MAKTTWKMNGTQTNFVNELRAHAEGVTLFELALEGKEFKTGSINTLITKGIVVTDGEREYKCEVVFNGKKVGITTRKGKVYKLAQ